jgi:protein-S-isoprenylcysteine O-methyltransferase Ste14
VPSHQDCPPLRREEESEPIRNVKRGGRNQRSTLKGVSTDRTKLTGLSDSLPQMQQAPQPPNDSARDVPGVITLPPLIPLGALALAFVLDAVWNLSLFPEPAQYVIGALLIITSLAILTAGVLEFRRAGTNVEVYKPSTVLVTSGVYKYSRNPLYISMVLLQAGIGVAADNPWVLILLIPTMALIRYGVIAREERYLERKFGDEYRRYKASVRRWL